MSIHHGVKQKHQASALSLLVRFALEILNIVSFRRVAAGLLSRVTNQVSCVSADGMICMRIRARNSTATKLVLAGSGNSTATKLVLAGSGTGSRLSPEPELDPKQKIVTV
jgi:hypothetical protein